MYEIKKCASVIYIYYVDALFK